VDCRYGREEVLKRAKSLSHRENMQEIEVPGVQPCTLTLHISSTCERHLKSLHFF